MQQKLNKIIDMGKPLNDKKGLDYMNEKCSSTSKTTTFVKVTSCISQDTLPNVPNLVESKFVTKHGKV